MARDWFSFQMWFHQWQFVTCVRASVQSTLNVYTCDSRRQDAYPQHPFHRLCILPHIRELPLNQLSALRLCLVNSISLHALWHCETDNRSVSFFGIFHQWTSNLRSGTVLSLYKRRRKPAKCTQRTVCILYIRQHSQVMLTALSRSTNCPLVYLCNLRHNW